MIDTTERSWEGSYFDGECAAKQAALIRLTGDGLLLELAEDESRAWGWAETRLTQGEYPTEPVRIEFSDSVGAAVVEDRGFLEAYRAATLHLGGRRERPLRIDQILLAVVALTATVAGVYLWGAQAVGTIGAAIVPSVWEDRVGKAVVNALAPAEQRCPDSAAQTAVEQIVARLRDGLEERQFEYTVIVSKPPGLMGPNAFAAPGGYIVVFDSMLELTSTPEELAGVLAHEIQHVERRHVTRGMLREMVLNAVTSTFISVVPGGTGTWGETTALDFGSTLAGLAYQRDDEREADQLGLKTMEAAGIDGAGMVSMFRSLSELTGDEDEETSYLTTHPSSSERAETLESMLSADAAPRPLLPTTNWSQVQGSCLVEAEE